MLQWLTNGEFENAESWIPPRETDLGGEMETFNVHLIFPLLTLFAAPGRKWDHVSRSGQWTTNQRVDAFLHLAHQQQDALSARWNHRRETACVPEPLLKMGFLEWSSEPQWTWHEWEMYLLRLNHQAFWVCLLLQHSLANPDQNSLPSRQSRNQLYNVHCWWFWCTGPLATLCDHWPDWSFMVV